VACTVALFAAVAPASAGDPFYGVFTTNLNAEPAVAAAALDAQAATGAGLIREHFYWEQIERTPGAFDFSRHDALVAAASQRGLTVLPVITATPQFYSTRPAGLLTDGWPPRDPSTIFRVAFELARRYGTLGTYWGCVAPGVLCRRPYRPLTAWQVWNEPDHPAWWRTGVDPVAYVNLLRYAYLGFKLGDPFSEVVLGGLSWPAVLPGSYLERLYGAGAAPFFDTLALHPYAPNVGSVVSLLRQMRQVAAAYYDAGTPIRVTEYGYATGGTAAWTTASTPCQAALIAATTRELAARRTELRLRSIVQFQWSDRLGIPNPWPNYAGLIFTEGTPKPALAAFTDAVAGRPPAPGQAVADVCEPSHQG